MLTAIVISMMLGLLLPLILVAFGAIADWDYADTTFIAALIFLGLVLGVPLLLGLILIH